MRKLIAILIMLAVCCSAIYASAHAQSGGDANGSGSVTMSDVVYIINYIFGGGPAPVACPCLQFDGKMIVDDTNWVRARVGDRVMPRGFDWYYLTDNDGKHWIATPDTIQWGDVDDTL